MYGRVLLIATNSARDAADVVEVELKDRFAGRIDGVTAACADRGRGRGASQGTGGQRRRTRGDRRRIGDRSGEGDRVDQRPADRRRTDDLRGIGDDAGLGSDGGWQQDDRDGPAGAAEDRRLRPRAEPHLPKKVTAASVANALAHCVEAIWTPKADPITETTAVEGVRALAAGLRQVLEAPTDLDARSNLLYGACLGRIGSGHRRNRPASQALPPPRRHLQPPPRRDPRRRPPPGHRVNAPTVPRAKARLEAALETDDLATGLFDLFAEAGIPTSLKELGLTEEQAQDAAARAVRRRADDPRPRLGRDAGPKERPDEIRLPAGRRPDPGRQARRRARRRTPRRPRRRDAQGTARPHPDLDPAQIDDVFLGNANGAGEENRDVARMAALLAGFPTSVPGTTVNRLCGSGLEAAIQAARAIETGDADLVIAGGVESMSRAPWVLPKPDKAFPHGSMTAESTSLGWRLVNPRMPKEWTISLGEATELLADRYRITREEQDLFALESHEKAGRPGPPARFDAELVPWDSLAPILPKRPSR